MGATIIVDRDSQKGIVIGKGGAVLKRVGTAVRKELEEQLGIKLYLKLWVKVKKIGAPTPPCCALLVILMVWVVMATMKSSIRR